MEIRRSPVAGRSLAEVQGESLRYLLAPIGPRFDPCRARKSRTGALRPRTGWSDRRSPPTPRLADKLHGSIEVERFQWIDRTIPIESAQYRLDEDCVSKKMTSGHFGIHHGDQAVDGSTL